MQSPLREDLLEELYRLRCSGKDRTHIPEIALLLGRQSCDLEEIIPGLERDGDIVSGSDGIALTPGGIEKGARIMRKHRVLERFFSEILGMPTETASAEACTLEHTVSDAAIARLGKLLGDRGTGSTLRKRFGKTCPSRNLMETDLGPEMVVSCIRCQAPVSRLHDLGIFPGETIHIVRRIEGNGVVVKVKDCDIALSREIAASIFVENSE
ncbi:MAG: metal-dependent transcriptional regulator [Methanoregulaceae archaeon]|nr:metal-dependent transcriptional regulator [Methanoregulaceae archaeon]